MGGRLFFTVAHLALTLAAGLSVASAPSNAAQKETTPLAPAPLPAPRASVNAFISGHSLTDLPMPQHLEAIANSLGTPLQWNRQYVVGSSIKARSRGVDGAAPWSGYRAGVDKAGQPIDVLAELKQPAGIRGRYDTLVITEQHGLLGSLTWNDTVRHLRHFHDRFVEANPGGTTYFYEPWLGLDNKSDPKRWVAYERAASPVWQCIATRINTSLAAEGRTDRIRSVPVALALAGLIDKATQGQGLAGVTLGDARSTVDGLVKDRVHLTETGSYFAALVTYAFVWGRSPVGAWHPQPVSPSTASALQYAVWEFATSHARTRVPLTLDQCQETLRRSFIQQYWSYARDVSWIAEMGAWRANLRWARYVLQWQWWIRRNTASNPFHFDPTRDQEYWFADH